MINLMFSSKKSRLAAQDSQIEAYKLQYDQLLEQFNKKSSELENLNSVYIDMQSKSNNKTEVNDELVCNLEKEIISLRNSLKNEREELKTLQSLSNQQINRLEDNQKSLADELENAQRTLINANKKADEINLKYNLTVKNLSCLEKEYSEFKLKANKTLQDKEDFIRVLQNSSGGNPQMSSDASHEKHVHHLQQQCDQLVQELSEYKNKYETIEQALKKAQNEVIPRAENEITFLKNSLDKEQSLSSKLKQDLSLLNEELKTCQNDCFQLKTSLTARIAERDEEIDKLRKQLVMRQQSRNVMTANSFDGSESNGESINVFELDQKLKMLTENLIQKQSANEQLSYSNQSLKIQLERAEKKLREMASSSSNNDGIVNLHFYL